MLDTTLFTTLNAQADQERFASVSYFALALWCEAESFDGFAEYFRKQAKEETDHTEKLHAHLLDRGVKPTLGALPSPRQQFADILEVAQHAFELEKENTRGIHAAYEAAIKVSDYPAQVLLHWFISEQVEEEAWTDKLLTLVNRSSCAGALANLDRHLMKILAE